MKYVRKICLYAKQLRNVCTTIEDCAMSMDPCIEEEDDPVASEMLFNQLEQGQKLILALTQLIMDGAEEVDKNAEKEDMESKAASAYSNATEATKYAEMATR